MAGVLMKDYINFLDRHKLKLIILTTLLVALMSISLKHLAFEGSYRIWFDQESKILKDYDHFRSTFSGDDTFVVAFSDEEGIFRPKAIKTIMELTEQFYQMGGVQRVDSLTNYQYISSEDEDLMVDDFIYDLENLEQKKALALHDKLILHQLISEDATTTMIAVRLLTKQGSDEALNIEVMEKIQAITDEYSQKSGYKFYISGTPAVTASLVTVSQHDAILLLPLAVVLVVIFLFILFRSVVGVLVPSVVIVFTFLIVLSMQMMLGYKLNNFTVNIPAFVTAVSIANVMHLYLAWLYYRFQEMGNRDAVEHALGRNIIPIALTSFTTAIGFATLGLSEIEPISTLGVAITTGATVAFILSITIAPSILLFLDDEYRVKPIRFLNFLSLKGYGSFIVRHDKRIVVSFLILFALIVIGLKDIKVDSNSIKYFGEKTTVRSGSDFVEERLTGSMVYEIILDSKKQNGIKNPQFLRTIVKFEGELRDNFDNIRFTTSLKDIVERMQKVLNPTATLGIPNEKNLVAQYLLLYSMSLPQGMEINDKQDIKEQFLRLSINTSIVDTSKDLEMIAWIRAWWENNTEYTADVQGQTAIFAYMQDSVTDTLITSITLTLIIVAFAMLLIFKNLRMLWIFILPNIAPILLVAGVMGHLGITIDIGVAISAAVILGIAVDDTIHFFSKYFDGIKERNFEETIDYILNHSGNAMILTTIILSFTFSLFGLSSFVPNINFAIVTVIALNLALVLDLILLPALLSLFARDR
jgi:predicted RND superfamily exporter protein